MKSLNESILTLFSIWNSSKYSCKTPQSTYILNKREILSRLCDISLFVVITPSFEGIEEWFKIWLAEWFKIWYLVFVNGSTSCDKRLSDWSTFYIVLMQWNARYSAFWWFKPYFPTDLFEICLQSLSFAYSTILSSIGTHFILFWRHKLHVSIDFTCNTTRSNIISLYFILKIFITLWWMTLKVRPGKIMMFHSLVLKMGHIDSRFDIVLM